MTDGTKEVRQNDGERGLREDTEDIGQLEERGETEEKYMVNVYESLPDLRSLDKDKGRTKKVRNRDGERGQRGDTGDSGHLEERGEWEERVVEIYQSVDDFRSHDVVPGPQDGMWENTAGRQSQGQSSKTVRHLIVVAVCQGMLCIMLLGVIIHQAAHCDCNSAKTNRETNHSQSDVNQLKRDKSDESCQKCNNGTFKVCPSGWQSCGCSCYNRSTEWKTWEESRAECQKTPGADLVVITSKEEQEFIRGLNRCDGTSWIGLNRTGGNWTWVDGAPLTTEYWDIDTITGGGGDCTIFRHGAGKWKTSSCKTGKFPWICEIPEM